MKSWSESLAELQRNGQPHVLVTVIATAGSTPRDVASKMVVTAEHTIDSIGGGQLEFLATQYARELLQADSAGGAVQEIKQFPLGASAAQCCGGHASVLFECFAANEAELLLFGAGHVGKALVSILQTLPVKNQWIDTREGFLPSAESLPSNVAVQYLEDALDALLEGPAGAHVVIMTHDHQLDYSLAEAALKMDRFASVGVIGSKTKAARFRHRLQMRDLTDAQLANFRCPIGLPEVAGKRPTEVAVSIAGQIIADYQADKTKPTRKGVSMETMTALFSSGKTSEPVK